MADQQTRNRVFGTHSRQACGGDRAGRRQRAGARVRGLVERAVGENLLGEQRMTSAAEARRLLAVEEKSDALAGDVSGWSRWPSRSLAAAERIESAAAASAPTAAACPVSA